MYKGRATEMTNMKDENPAAVERSSTQIIKQPRMKKSIQRRQIKSRFSRRRPVNSASQQKRGKSRSQDSNSHKRMISYSQKKRLKAYYSSLRGCRAKFPPESGVSHIPPKTVNKQSNSPVMKAEDRNAGSHVCRTDNLQPPLTEKSRVSSMRENQSLEKRSKLSAVEKRRYQTVSEYQFIYPAQDKEVFQILTASSKLSVSLGKAVFHCNKVTVKQQLRSIYLGTGRQKSLKPTHQSTQMPCNQWEKNKAQRENTKTDASCPMGSEFLRSKYPNTIPHGLTSLMYKINKLVLVSEAEAVPPCTPAMFPHCPQLQQQPLALKSSLPAAALPGRKTSTEEWHVEQESTPNWSLQGTTGNMPRATPTSFTEPRPSSAKDLCRKALSKTLGEDNQNGDSSKQEDAHESMLEANASGKGGMTHTRNVTAMPTFHSIPSKESVNAEVPLNVCSNTTQCLAGGRQWEPFAVDFSQPSAREEKIPGTLAHCSSGEKRQAYSFVPADSKKYKPMSMDTWPASGTEISLLD